MFTTFIAWSVIDAGAPYWVGFAVALAVRAGARGARRARGRPPVEGGPPLNAMIVTLGLLVLLQAAAGMIWGGRPALVPAGLLDQAATRSAATRSCSRPSTCSPCSWWRGDARHVVLFTAHEPRAADARRRLRARGRAPARRPGRPHVHARLGARVDWPARWPGCSWRRRCSSRPTPSTPCSSSASPPRSSAAWRARSGALVGGLGLGLALSYVSGYAGADVVDARRAGDPRRRPDGPPERPVHPRRRPGGSDVLARAADQTLLRHLAIALVAGLVLYVLTLLAERRTTTSSSRRWPTTSPRSPA